MDSTNLLVKLLLLFSIFLILRPYLNAIVFAVIVATILYPVYQKLKHPFFAFILVFLFYALLFSISAVIIRKLAIQLYSSLPSNLLNNGFLSKNIISNLPQNLTKENIFKAFNILSKIPSFAITFSLTLFLTYYLLVDLDRIENWFLKVFKHRKIFEDILTNINAVVLGFIIAYTLQFLTYFLYLLYLGIPNAFLISFAAVLFAILPLLGAWMALIYPAYLLYKQGQLVLAIFTLILPVIWTIFDSMFIKPRYSGYLHPALLLLAMFSGISLFGIAGILTGPVLLSFLLTMISLEVD